MRGQSINHASNTNMVFTFKMYALLRLQTTAPRVPRRGKHDRQSTSNTSSTPQQGEQPRRQRAPVVAGRSSAASNKIAAAKILRKKAVLCLDNLSTGNSCTPSDIKSLVSGLSAEVFVFEVKPRRRRGEDADDAVDRKAFWL